ncbi:amino acid adenylation domain-containing protein [Nostoc sp.]|uniref:amino acid adenylation domain-containing protein n=1 Tax=Nostoc sp. TaxID=1180 RepID=UPI002FFD325C
MQELTVEGFRLSLQQKRVWSQQTDGQQPYRTQFVTLIKGNLDIKVLESALQYVISRHEILRTTFHALPGMTIPLQFINNNAIPIVDFYDVKGLNPQSQKIKVEEIYHELNHLDFDFEHSSLLHISLVFLSEYSYILLLCLPAMIADAVTIKNLLREISRSYSACLHNQEISDEPFQYVDFTEWQNDIFAREEDRNIGKEYWLKQDYSALGNFKLPFEKCLSKKSEFNPQIFTLTIFPALVEKIEALAQQYDTTTSVVLLTCWQILLWRLTGQSEVMIGMGSDGRNYAELEETLGLFAKYLPVYCYLHEDDQFCETLKQTTESSRNALKWQEFFRYEDIIESKINDEKSLFYSLCFDFEEQPINYFTNDLSFSIQKQYICFEPFQIKLSGVRQDNSIITEFHYNSNSFFQEDIERLANQFHRLLESVIHYPEAAIAKLEILNERQRQQLLIEFNQTHINYPQDQLIYHLFETQADTIQNDVAVVFEDQQITYGELNAKANKLAHYLRRLGVGPEILVGLFVERSPQLIVGLLGILKAGGAYLPLDPALPPEGLAFRLEDAQVGIVLTQQSLVDMLPEHKARVVLLDTEWSAIATESDENITSDVKPENLAYVLFTSGSTGKPKGVAIEHQQLFNYVNAITQKLNLEVCRSFANVSTFAADLGNTTIFPSLCTGACLHIISQQRASDPDALADYFRRYPIDCLKIVPSHLAALLTSSHPKDILPRQRLILGGEACSWKLISQLQQLATECLIFNHYGPTEATVGVLTYQIQLHETGQNSQTVPIGRPLSNTQIYLLDSHFQPVPVGVTGEIYIGGAGLARGYLNHPELTTEKFISNPFQTSRGVKEDQYSNSERLYKTGDLGRYQPDGNLEFIGRIDHQVKVRGFRIELGEIETLLGQHPTVDKTVVLAREDQSGNKRLVAYVVLQSEIALNTTQLREFLQAKLPEYMIPSVFVRLKALPLTANGKVDRQALPAPDISRLEWEGNVVAPRTSVEKKLAQLWSQILGLQQVGIYDNFFELGGDSILSMQVIAKAKQVGLHLTPKQIFEHQTIANLAAVAQTNIVIQAEQGLVTGETPLTPIQEWFFEQNQPELHHWNQEILLEVRQALDPVLLEQAIEQLLKHHDALRMRFVCQEFAWEQFNADSCLEIPFSHVDLSSFSPDKQESAFDAVVSELQSSLNILQGQLVKITLFDLGANKSMRLLLIIHHLVVDGVSWRILLEDLQTAYEHLKRKEAIQLPSKTTSFRQWAQKLQEYAFSTQLHSELEYWLAESRRQISPIPVDFAEGVNNNTVAGATTVSVALSVEETQALLQDVPAAYQTQINDVLLTALVQAYKQWTGSSFLLVDLEGHGREEISDDVDLSRTVGWFTTIFPVLLHLKASDNPGEALQAVKQQLQTIPNRGLGYGVLRYLCKDTKIIEQLQTRPSAEMRFNYLGQSDQVLAESPLFATALQTKGTSRSLRGKRSYLLDINGIVVGKKLQLDWTYSQGVHSRETIEAIAKSFVEALRSLITHCQSFKAKIDTTSTSEILETLIADTALDPKISCDVYDGLRLRTLLNYVTEPTKIFLTGATGFVGAFLLDELLRQTQADIYCLVRSTDAESGKQRLQKHLESYLLWNESFSDRIIPVVGDLSQPLLGLSDQQFQLIASQIDLIYHNGATINLIYPYSVLKAANVLGTQEVLWLASQNKLKPVHYISTLSVLSSDNPGKEGVPYGGYAQTKWVAEQLIIAARERGIPTSIYRLGRVSGHSKTGVCNPSDRLYRMIKGFIQLGSVPDMETTIDMTPVDFVSQAIVSLAHQKKSLGKVFHIYNPQPSSLTELLNWIRSFGYPLQKIVDNQWQTEMLNNPEDFIDNPLYTLIPFFQGQQSEDTSETESLKQFDFHLQNTLDELASTSITCPPIDAELLNTYFSYLIQSSFLNPPQLSDIIT